MLEINSKLYLFSSAKKVSVLRWAKAYSNVFFMVAGSMNNALQQTSCLIKCISLFNNQSHKKEASHLIPLDAAAIQKSAPDTIKQKINNCIMLLHFNN